MDLKEKWLCLNCGITENEEHTFWPTIWQWQNPFHSQSELFYTLGFNSEKYYTWPKGHALVTFPYQIFRLGHALTSRFPCNIQSSQYMFNTQRIFHFRPRTSSCRQYNYVGTHIVQIQQNSSTSASTSSPLYFKILPQHLLPLLWGQKKVAPLHKLYIRGVMPLHCQILPYLFDETTGVQGHLDVSPQRELLPYGPHWEHCGCPLILNLKLRRRFSVTKLKLKNFCKCFNWMLQSQSKVLLRLPSGQNQKSIVNSFTW